jgi:alkanesulfonate monooxygenase SsuD/methylene tetrahydromethanopterin reductase-like flavin-dependent oxidoreductase (luciferase family)
MVLGTPSQCQEELEHIAKTFDVDEVMVVNVTHSFKPRISSYEMLAEQFEFQHTKGE